MARRKHEWILYGRQFGRQEPALTLPQQISTLEASSVEKAILVAARVRSKHQGFTDSIPDEEVAQVVQAHPDRFYGIAGIDPFEGMEGVRELERAVKELGVVGAHVYPHWFGLEPDRRKYYPFCAKCVELDIPHTDTGGPLPHLHNRPAAHAEGGPAHPA